MEGLLLVVDHKGGRLAETFGHGLLKRMPRYRGNVALTEQWRAPYLGLRQGIKIAPSTVIAAEWLTPTAHFVPISHPRWSYFPSESLFRSVCVLAMNFLYWTFPWPFAMQWFCTAPQSPFRVESSGGCNLHIEFESIVSL